MPQSMLNIPRASRTCPCLVVPSGSVKLTISLYLGNLTWLIRQQLDSTAYVDEGDTDIVEDDEGTVDTTDGVVLQVRRHRVGRRRLSWVTHGC